MPDVLNTGIEKDMDRNKKLGLHVTGVEQVKTINRPLQMRTTPWNLESKVHLICTFGREKLLFTI